MQATITDIHGEATSGEVSGRPEAFELLIGLDGARLDITSYSPITRSERTETYRRWTDGYTYADPHSARRLPARVIDHGDRAGYIDRSMFDYPTSATCAPSSGEYPLGATDELRRGIDRARQS